MPAVADDISTEILDLKKKIGATILAHYYQEGEIQSLADITGDSLKLAREATKVQSPVIVFCGVLFMAETAKMLNPSKKVLLPDLKAGCSLVDSCPPEKLRRYQEMLRENGRKFQTVTYINSSAAVKALSDWVVTSGNAEEVRKVPADQEILFVPDKHLGRYLSEVIGRKMILWDGACMVHEIFSVHDLVRMKAKHPGAEVIAHPECPKNILEHAEFIGGTEAMLKYVGNFQQPREFIVATEPNLMWQMESRFKQHTYYPVPGITCACNKCPHMARNTLEKIRDCMRDGKPEILWQPEFDKAKEVLTRSLLNPPASAPSNRWAIDDSTSPARFLVRMAHPCQYVAKLPSSKGRVADLLEAARINNFAELEGLTNFADVRLAWNDAGLGVQCTVSGKEQPPKGDSDKPRSSDGLSLWLDMRDSRASHRASRYCHQFHFLPAGGGKGKDEPWFGQLKINRAQADAPLCKTSDVPFACEKLKTGYRLEGFLSAAALTGWDPEQHPRLGFYYCVRDGERGEQFLSVNADFPYWDDPSLWSVLELVK